jgi:hypothetical protein
MILGKLLKTVNFSLPVDVNIGPNERQASRHCPPARTVPGFQGDRPKARRRKNPLKQWISVPQSLARRVLISVSGSRKIPVE